MNSHLDILRTIRSASFNDEAAAELLRELGRLALTPRLARRVNDIVDHLEHDAKALEALYTALSTGDQPATTSAPQPGGTFPTRPLKLLD